MSTPRPHPPLPPLPILAPTTITHPSLGTLTGSLLTDAITSQPLCKRFTAVPYAQTPVRWKRAQPLDFWGGYRYGSKGETYDEWGSVCPQRKYTLYDYRANPYSWPADPPAKYTEDCLQLNIWTPVDDPPEGELWPVLFYIHGGWLQVGQNNQGRRYDPSYMIGEGVLKCVVVAPAYRLNLFGFLTCQELVNEGGHASLNLGLWDQKLALDWTFSHISHFSGSPSLVTLAGLSAGAHSVHQHLHHFLSHPPTSSSPTSLPVGIILYSNAIPSSPRTISESQPQFEELCAAVSVSPPSLEGLRKVGSEELVRAMEEMEAHTFRVCQDHEGGDGNGFMGESAMRSLVNGELGRFCKDNGIRVILGEVDNEDGIFAQTNPPLTPTSTYPSLHAYYPHALLTPLLPLYAPLPLASHPPSHHLATHGLITATVQVYASSRLLLEGLQTGGMVLGTDVFHYRINKRPKVAEEFYTPPELGVSHAMETGWWWYSRSIGMSEEDLERSREWVRPVQAFLRGGGEEVKGWGKGVRVLGKDGVIRGEQEDERLVGEEGERVGRVVGVLRELAMGER